MLKDFWAKLSKTIFEPTPVYHRDVNSQKLFQSHLFIRWIEFFFWKNFNKNAFCEAQTLFEPKQNKTKRNAMEK